MCLCAKPHGARALPGLAAPERLALEPMGLPGWGRPKKDGNYSLPDDARQAACGPAIRSALCPRGLLDRDLDVHPGRQVELGERVDGLVRRIDDVHQALVGADLE